MALFFFKRPNPGSKVGERLTWASCFRRGEARGRRAPGVDGIRDPWKMVVNRK